MLCCLRANVTMLLTCCQHRERLPELPRQPLIQYEDAVSAGAGRV
jgi:hypothetical protein